MGHANLIRIRKGKKHLYINIAMPLPRGVPFAPDVTYRLLDIHEDLFK